MENQEMLYKIIEKLDKLADYFNVDSPMQGVEKSPIKSCFRESHTLEEILDTNIDKLDLNVRFRNAIQRKAYQIGLNGKYLKIKDIITYQADFWNATNLGKVGYQKLKDAILERFNKELFEI